MQIFLHRFFPHAVHQMDLFLDEKAAYGKSQVCGPHISFVSEAGTESKLGRRLKQGTQHSCISCNILTNIKLVKKLVKKPSTLAFWRQASLLVFSEVIANSTPFCSLIN